MSARNLLCRLGVVLALLVGAGSTSSAANSGLPDIYMNNGTIFLTNMNFDPTVESYYHIYKNHVGTTFVHVALWGNGQKIDETYAGYPKGKVDFVVVFGGIGTDHVFNESGWPSRMWGGPGNDHLTGGSANDEIYGGDGIDTISGFTGDDYLDGEGGDDIIAGQGGNDKLFGGEGLDVITGGDGNDWIDGGGDQLADHLTGDEPLSEGGKRFVDTFVLHLDPESGLEGENIQDFDNTYLLTDKIFKQEK